MTKDEAIDILIGEIATDSEEQNEALDIAIDIMRKTAWVSVTERLPEESGYYLITSNSGYVYDVEIRFFFFQHERRKEWKKGFGDVIAWQPLPEPYKGGDAE